MRYKLEVHGEPENATVLLKVVHYDGSRGRYVSTVKSQGSVEAACEECFARAAEREPVAKLV